MGVGCGFFKDFEDFFGNMEKKIDLRLFKKQLNF